MTLRRKLLITFGTLAFLGIMIAGVSVWAIIQWHMTNEKLWEHSKHGIRHRTKLKK